MHDDNIVRVTLPGRLVLVMTLAVKSQRGITRTEIAPEMLHVGFAETDITPKLGSQSPGGMQARRLNEVHDPLKAVAMVIQNDQTTVALVGIDSHLYQRGSHGPSPRSDRRRHQDSWFARPDRRQPHAWRRAGGDLLRVGG